MPSTFYFALRCLHRFEQDRRVQGTYLSYSCYFVQYLVLKFVGSLPGEVQRIIIPGKKSYYGWKEATSRPLIMLLYLLETLHEVKTPVQDLDL